MAVIGCHVVDAGDIADRKFECCLDQVRVDCHLGFSFGESVDNKCSLVVGVFAGGERRHGRIVGLDYEVQDGGIIRRSEEHTSELQSPR